ncbi:MAG: response regulator [Bdellovibrionales bacterium]|jgi:two-component system chemotaxis response regulator CheY|nr:response regulator [Bdellovibrionales bacterium]MBL7671181.1 response regulator [Pseudobdellovibrionaceae bacterium]
MFPTTTKFLVIDDFATMRKIIKKTLNELGYTLIEEADDGATAWPLIEAAHAKGEPYGFIISDWNMPKMAGIDLLKQCRAEDKYKGVPFMLVTAESEQKQILEAAKAGVSDYVVKPFNSATLKQKMEKVWAKFSQTAKVA